MGRYDVLTVWPTGEVSPTLAEACEVIEALLGERSMVSIAPWDAARAFLERVKARHG